MAMHPTNSNPTNRFLLISYPRTTSSLFTRILSLDQQPNILTTKLDGYFFLPVYILMTELGLLGKHVDTWSEDQKTQIQERHRACFKAMEEHIARAESLSKGVFIKEHIIFLSDPVVQTRVLFGNGEEESARTQRWTLGSSSQNQVDEISGIINETILSDTFLTTFKPTFLIRHPALAFPSFFRVYCDSKTRSIRPSEPDLDLPELPLIMTLRFQKSLYTFFESHIHKTDPDSPYPIILDASDITHNPDIIIRYSELIGLDPSVLKFSWEFTNDETAESQTRRMRDTLWASKGIMKDRTPMEVDIQVEAGKWKEEFGDTVAGFIQRFVVDAMEDYNFFFERRLGLSS